MKGPQHADHCAASVHSEQFCLHDTDAVAVGQDNRSAHIATQVRRLSHQLKISKPAAGIHAVFRQHVDARQQKHPQHCAGRGILLQAQRLDLKNKRKKHYTLRGQFNEEPRVILGCPGPPQITYACAVMPCCLSCAQESPSQHAE